MRRLLFCSLVLVTACTSPDARISAASQSDPACRAELHGGLEALRRELGLAITVDDPAVDALLASGELDSTYARDGARFTASFGMFFEGETCVLRLYAMSTGTPGSTSTRFADHGSVRLDTCTCVEAP